MLSISPVANIYHYLISRDSVEPPLSVVVHAVIQGKFNLSFFICHMIWYHTNSNLLWWRFSPQFNHAPHHFRCTRFFSHTTQGTLLFIYFTIIIITQGTLFLHSCSIFLHAQYPSLVQVFMLFTLSISKPQKRESRGRRELMGLMILWGVFVFADAELEEIRFLGSCELWTFA